MSSRCHWAIRGEQTRILITFVQVCRLVQPRGSCIMRVLEIERVQTCLTLDKRDMQILCKKKKKKETVRISNKFSLPYVTKIPSYRYFPPFNSFLQISLEIFNFQFFLFFFRGQKSKYCSQYLCVLERKKQNSWEEGRGTGFSSGI